MKSHKEEVLQYCRDITSGVIPSGMYTKRAVKRFLADTRREDDESFLYSFVPEQADKIINFAETLFIPDINKRLELLSWHKFIYYNLFGFYLKADSTRRRFRQAYVEVARKNSKTTSLLFPIVLYDFMFTPAAESFFVSKDNNQSAKTYIELKNVLVSTFNPDKREIVITDSRIRRESTNSFIQFFSSESRGTDSFKNSCSVIDEFWNYDNDEVVTSFRFGSRARKNTLVLIITSAGLNISGPCYAENEKTRKILNNVIADDTYFGIIYAYDDRDDWKDKKNFIKANPSLGTILREDILENDLNDALITPSHKNDFLAKTCGIWVSATSNWIPLTLWDTPIRNQAVDVEEFTGETCCGALDLSSVSDFTVYTLCFKRDDLFYLYHKFYIPSGQIMEKYKAENINIREWVERGIVTAIPGPTIDYDYVYEDVIADSKKFSIVEVCYDSWHSNNLIKQLDDAIPNVAFVEKSQSLKSMTGPTKNYERLIAEDKIVDPNPVSKWMVSNATIKIDANNNYKPLKEYKSSTKRIDSVITSIMAIDRYINSDDVRPARSFDDVLRLFK